MRRLTLVVVALVTTFVVLGLVVAGVAQRVAPSFDPTVPEPAYLHTHPKVLFDEAHRNHRFYGPFVELIQSDGYAVTSNTEAFSTETLHAYDVVVIVNPNFEGRPDNNRWPAFTDAECDAVVEWVFGGGLLLITDYGTTAVAAEQLSQRFGIDIRHSLGTEDPVLHEYDPGTDSERPGWLVFSRENRLLRDHPITRGRTAAEVIDRVVTFYGVSLKGPDEATPFLSLSPSAVDLFGARPDHVSAAGRAQGIAGMFGQGRVVVLGEARMLTATVVGLVRPLGMNRPGSDDRQLALNIMHWLSDLL